MSSVRKSGAAHLALLLLLFCLPGWGNDKTSGPPGKVDRIVVEKSAPTMRLMRDGKVLKTYKVALSREPVGAKERTGDHKVPEGEYVVDSKNPHSRFHLALHISYPNAADRERARKLAQRRMVDLIRKTVVYQKKEDELDTWRVEGATAAARMTLDSKLLDSECVLNFPGVKLLWTRDSIQRLMDLVKEAMEKLPRRLFDHSLLIKMRAGVLEGTGGEPWSWKSLAEHFAITEDRARYAEADAICQRFRALGYNGPAVTDIFGRLIDNEALEAERKLQADKSKKFWGE